MSLPKDKAEEILDLCLRSESPQMRAKVYEIISLTGIQPNDPMFLVLALTGQMRVFLEAAPLEMGELLQAWKSQSTQSMNELIRAIAQVKEAQEMQVKNIKQSVEEINSKNVNDISNLHKSLVSEILQANTEVQDTVQESVNEIENARKQLTELNTKLQAERNSNIKVMKALIEGITVTTKDLELANSQINNSIEILNKLKLSKIFNKWIIWGSLISTLVVASLLVFGLIRMSKAEQSSNTVVHMNLIEETEENKRYWEQN